MCFIESNAFIYCDPMAPGTRLRKEISPTMQDNKYVSCQE